MNSGILITSKCYDCKHVIWPPSRICPKCLADNIEWVNIDGIGKLIEFSESFLMEQPSIFGMVQLNDNITLMARIKCDDVTQLKKDISVKMIRCGIINKDPYYEFQPI